MLTRMQRSSPSLPSVYLGPVTPRTRQLPPVMLLIESLPVQVHGLRDVKEL